MMFHELTPDLVRALEHMPHPLLPGAREAFLAGKTLADVNTRGLATFLEQNPDLAEDAVWSGFWWAGVHYATLQRGR